MQEAGYLPSRSIEIVAWMNEEGSRFAPGMMGSAVFAGRRHIHEVMDVSDARERRDALMSAVHIIAALETWCHDEHDLVRFTIGRMNVAPNAPSVVPGSVSFSVDLRHPSSEILQKLGDGLSQLCQAHAGPCDAEIKELSTADSLEFPEDMRKLLRQCAGELQLGHIELPSAAGHDARYLHTVCPTGMIFVPCKDGVSHHPSEWATEADLVAGARVLTQALVELAG